MILRESGGVCVADEGVVLAADKAVLDARDEGVLDAVAEAKTAAEDVGFEEEPELDIYSIVVQPKCFHTVNNKNKLRT